MQAWGWLADSFDVILPLTQKNEKKKVVLDLSDYIDGPPKTLQHIFGINLTISPHITDIPAIKIVFN